MLPSETLRHFYRASGFPPETSPTAEATAIASCSNAISSAAKVGVGESGRVGPKEGEEALEAFEGLFEKSTWMGGYSVAVLKLILEQIPNHLPNLPNLLCLRHTPPHPWTSLLAHRPPGPIISAARRFAILAAF